MRCAARPAFSAGILLACVLFRDAPAGAVEFKDVQDAQRAGDRAKFISLLDEYIPKHPKDLRAFAMRGRALVEMGKYEKALADLDKAVAAGFGADSGLPLYDRGRAHEALGELDKALADFDKSIEVNPKVAERYVSRGKVLWHQGEIEKALADFDKGIELNDKFAAAWALRGRMRFEAACEIVTVQEPIMG